MIHNLLRPAVGIETLVHLYERQQVFRAAYQGRETPIITTKRKPVRDLTGGSVYWVIKRAIQARQVILHVDMYTDPNYGERCVVFLDEQLVRTEDYPQKPFQGWRYLDPSKAPKDIRAFSPNETPIPQDMEEDLRQAGLV